MTTAEQEEPLPGHGWERLGRAAEQFARRVAEDARKFAERIEEHASAFADDVAQEWWGRHERHHHGDRPAPDVRRIFEDVRSILADVIDGVDELIGRIFPAAPEEPWARVVANRDVTCGSCGAAIAAGSEGWVRRTAAGADFRCLGCGAPGTSSV